MMMFFKNRVLLLSEILFLIVISLTPLLWFRSEKIVVGIDSGYAIDHSQYFNQRSYTWLSANNFGVDMSAEVGIVPYNALPALIKLSGVPEYSVQKVLFIGWFFVISLSIYCLLYSLFPSKKQWVIRLAGVSIYSFNLHIYSFWLQGEQPILASYVILPLFLLFFLRFIQKKSSVLKSAIYLNIVFFLFSSGGMRGLPLLGPVIISMILAFTYFFIINFKTERFGYIIRFVRLAFWSIIFLILLNAYFLLPFLYSFKFQYNNQVELVGGIGSAIEWARFISSHASFLNLFRLHGDNNWYDKPYLWSYQYLSNSFLVIASFLFPIFAFLAPLFTNNKKEKTTVLFFIFLALSGIFLSAGTHSPLGSFYTFLMEHLPGFAAFRSAYYKFMPTVYLSFSVLIGVTIYKLSEYLPEKTKSFFSITTVLLILVYHYPFFTNSNFEFNRPFSSMVKVPSYVKEFAKIEKELKNDYRMLITPPSSSAYDIKSYKWGYWGSYPIFSLVTNRGTVSHNLFGYNGNENKIIAALYHYLRKEDFSNFLYLSNNTNIKYILVTSDIANNYELSLAEDPSVYTAILSNNKDQFKSVWRNGSWELFEIIGNEPKKIQVFNSLTINNTFFPKVESSLYTKYAPFVNVDKGKNALEAFSTHAFVEYDCISCGILEKAEDIKLTNPRILPTSFLYPIKLRFENHFENVKTDDERLNAFLGLSFKRSSELASLNSGFNEADSDEWEKVAYAIRDNWKNINNEYEKNYKNGNKYEVLKRILQYQLFESNIINDIITNNNLDKKSKLARSLTTSLEEIERFKDEIANTLSAKKWRNTFIFDISDAKDQIYINSGTLPKDFSGNTIYPSTYIVDKENYKFIQSDSKDSTISLTKSGNYLSLQFNNVNLFKGSEKFIEYNKTSMSCWFSPISNYSGTKKYVITANKIGSNKAYVFIKRNYDTFKTESSKVKTLYGFNPDSGLELSKNKSEYVEYIFSGRINDRSADVYFCTEESVDPSSVFQDIELTEVFIPEIYSVENKNKMISKLPNVTFSKINPTEYTFTIVNAEGPFILGFAEGFSPLWEINIENSKIMDHFPINGYANGWLIDKPGTYNGTITFKTQELFIAGTIITAASVIGFIIFGCFQLFKYVKHT